MLNDTSLQLRQQQQPIGNVSAAAQQQQNTQRHSTTKSYAQLPRQLRTLHESNEQQSLNVLQQEACSGTATHSNMGAAVYVGTNRQYFPHSTPAVSAARRQGQSSGISESPFSPSQRNNSHFQDNTYPHQLEQGHNSVKYHNEQNGIKNVGSPLLCTEPSPRQKIPHLVHDEHVDRQPDTCDQIIQVQYHVTLILYEH